MKKEYQALYAELEKYENAGVRIRLDNLPASPMQIVSAHMIKEETSYMRDYVLDDKGSVRELAFHQVTKVCHIQFEKQRKVVEFVVYTNP